MKAHELDCGFFLDQRVTCGVNLDRLNNRSLNVRDLQASRASIHVTFS